MRYEDRCGHARSWCLLAGLWALLVLVACGPARVGGVTDGGGALGDGRAAADGGGREREPGPQDASAAGDRLLPRDAALEAGAGGEAGVAGDASVRPDGSPPPADACVPLTCGPSGILCGTVPDGCGGLLDCGPCCSSTCRLVVDDPLDGSTVGQRNGGRFVSGGGWQTRNLNNRIVYDLGAPIQCGRLVVDIRNFEPPNQYVHYTQSPVNCDATDVDCYVHFLSVWRADHLNHHTAAQNCESQVQVQATGPETSDRPYQFKLKAATAGWDGGRRGAYSGRYFWDTSHTYHLVLKWNSERVALEVDDAGVVVRSPLSWPCDEGYQPMDSPNCLDANGRRLDFRYVVLGRDQNPAGGFLLGPIYSNVKIYECNP